MSEEENFGFGSDDEFSAGSSSEENEKEELEDKQKEDEELSSEGEENTIQLGVGKSFSEAMSRILQKDIPKSVDGIILNQKIIIGIIFFNFFG